MAKPKLCLIPAAQGTSLYSVLPSSGVGDFSFNRSGSATRINAQGLIETVGSGVSRLNYPMIDGVVKGCPHHILEPQRSNLVPYSEDFSQWANSNSSDLSNQIISPNGTLNADKLITNNGSINGQITKILVKNASAITYSYSVFAKKGEWDRCNLYVNDASSFSNRVQFFVDLETGNIIQTSTAGSFSSASSSSEDYGNGWYRFSVTFTTSTETAITARIYSISSLYTTGDGTSGIYIYGAMLEEGSFPTSYIPNYGTSSGVTRSAETANGSGDAATFNSEQGVLMAEISALDNDGTYKQILLHDNAYNNRIALRYMPISNQINAVLHNGSIQADFTYNLANALDFNKIAFKYKENDFALWVNGIEIDTDGTGTTFSANTLEKIDFDFINNYFFYGKTKQLQYFDTADIDLEQLTSWVSFQEMAEGQLYSVE